MSAIALPEPAVRRPVAWSDLVHSRPLAGGDRIVVQEERDVLAPGRVGITLELGPGLSSWKGIQAGEILLCQCAGTLTHSAARLDLHALMTRPLTLWKAESLGLHRPAYTLNDLAMHLRGGNALVFRWLHD